MGLRTHFISWTLESGAPGFVAGAGWGSKDIGLYAGQAQGQGGLLGSTQMRAL